MLYRFPIRLHLPEMPFTWRINTEPSGFITHTYFAVYSMSFPISLNVSRIDITLEPSSNLFRTSLKITKPKISTPDGTFCVQHSVRKWQKLHCWHRQLTSRATPIIRAQCRQMPYRKVLTVPSETKCFIIFNKVHKVGNSKYDIPLSPYYRAVLQWLHILFICVKRLGNKNSRKWFHN